MRFSVIPAFIALAACAPQVPDSNPSTNGRGVGFDSYDAYAAQQRAAREAELSRRTAPPVPEAQAIASETLGVLNATRPATGSVAGTAPVGVASTAPVPTTAIATAPVTTAPIATAPVAAEPLAAPGVASVNNPAISDEQSFDAVTQRETIESDAERLERQRREYTLIQPEAVPERPGNSAPNIVAYALRTQNSVGQSIYRRSRPSEERAARACAAYPSPDRAQEAFLAAGGPERDRNGLDPDGDGFACTWDPAPFRTAQRRG